ncbi:MAG: hypothetical protein RI958_1435 [Actinomycetota bacterium]|jgi:hypothetical protein
MTRPLVVACGALVRELRAVLDADGLLSYVDVDYLPANLHNRPERIVTEIDGALTRRLADHPDRPVLIGYADCGTGGALDAYLEQRTAGPESRIRRLPGAHCYEFFAGAALFADEHEREPGTFYLTDFLAKHFEPLVWQGLGLDRHPELRDLYFANYRRVLLLSQTDDQDVVSAASAAAHRLGLPFEHRHVGLESFADAVGLVVRSSRP